MRDLSAVLSRGKRLAIIRRADLHLMQQKRKQRSVQRRRAVCKFKGKMLEHSGSLPSGSHVTLVALVEEVFRP